MSDSQSTPIPLSWQEPLKEAVAQPSFARLQAYVAEERQREKVFPPESMVYSALELTPFEDVNVVILGQDPYHDDNQAHGLAFSVQPGTKIPPSLRNIFKELQADLGCPVSKEGSLIPWAKQGVLLLNTSLTVRAHEANSHRGKGWEEFTDAVISAVNARARPAVFVLWGASAQKKRALIDADRNTIIESAHPSPLSAKSGFFGSRPFSRINAALESYGQAPINWCL